MAAPIKNEIVALEDVPIAEPGRSFFRPGAIGFPDGKERWKGERSSFMPATPCMPTGKSQPEEGRAGDRAPTVVMEAGECSEALG